MKPPLSYVPALPAAAGMAAGIVCSSLGAGWAAFAAATVCFGMLYWLKQHFTSFFFLFAAVGAAIAIGASRPHPPVSILDKRQAFDGEAKMVEDMPSGARRCVIEIDGHLCLAYVQDNAFDLAPGCKVEFKGTLSLFDSDHLLPGDNDFARNLRLQGIWCRAFVEPGTFRVTKAASGFDAIAARVRDAMFDAIVTSPVDGPTAAFLLACMLGDDAYMLDEPRSAFSTAGIAHVLALSGLHVGILASILSLLFLPLNLWHHGRAVKSVATLAVIWAYALVTGMSPSVMRAAVMISAIIAGYLLRRQSFSANALLLAAVVIIAVTPFSIFEAGFQLSFAAVASILIVMRILPESLSRYPILKFVASLFLLPIAAMAGSGIVYMFYFGQFPLSFIISNVVAGVLFPPILAGGFLLMSLTAIGINAAWLGWLVDEAYKLLSFIIGSISSIPGAAVSGISFSAWAFLPYFIALAICGWAISTSSKKVRAGLFLSAGGFVVLAFGVMFFVTPQAPVAELYIPKEKPQCLIARSRDEVCALPLCSDTAAAMRQCEIAHLGFLRLRGCDSLRLMPTVLDLGAIARHGDIIVMGGKSVALIRGSDPANYTACNYALLCEGFTSNISEVIEAVNPDTILLSASLHPSRAKRLQSQCAGQIPCINLRHHPFSLIIK